MLAEQRLREGRPDDALTELQRHVRQDPSNAGYRAFLFQLLCVLGQWDRARAQLKTLADLDPGSLALAHVYGAAITCELIRREVFAGARTPLVLGEPLPWVALLVQALSEDARGAGIQAGDLRAQAREQARAVPGSVDGQPFEWIADADSRLGPAFERIRTMALEAASALRDLVWRPAHLELVNGGEAAALVPARYPGSEADRDELIRLGRKTEWDEVAPDSFHGRGQRMLATDAGEYSILDIRRVELHGTEP
jgi:type VI secretion system protein ImpE